MSNAHVDQNPAGIADVALTRTVRLRLDHADTAGTQRCAYRVRCRSRSERAASGRRNVGIEAVGQTLPVRCVFEIACVPPSTGGSASVSQPSTPGPWAAVDDIRYVGFGTLVVEYQTILRLCSFVSHGDSRLHRDTGKAWLFLFTTGKHDGF